MNTPVLKGAGFLHKGFRLIIHPKLCPFILLPILINIIVFSTLLALSVHYFDVFIQWVESLLPTWLAWLEWILWFLFVVTALFVVTYTFTFIANLIAAPLNGLLAERVQRLLTNQAPRTEPILHMAVRSIARQISLLGYYLPRALGLLILFLIPGVNIIAAPLWFLFNAWTMCLQYLDYPTDNNQISFSQMRKAASKQRWLHFEFGLATLLLTMVPIVNFFLMAAAVTGATAMWVEEQKKIMK